MGYIKGTLQCCGVRLSMPLMFDKFPNSSEELITDLYTHVVVYGVSHLVLGHYREEIRGKLISPTDMMATISQKIFSDAFSLWKVLYFG